MAVDAVDIVFPTHNFEFAYGAEIPVIVDVAVDELVEVHLFLDDGNRSIARMNSYNLEGAFEPAGSLIPSMRILPIRRFRLMETTLWLREHTR